MNLKRKAQHLREQSAQERKHWSPPADGTTIRIYWWWKDNSGTTDARAQENFCHFYRVVLFWAPLLYLSTRKVGKTRLAWILLSMLAMACIGAGLVFNRWYTVQFILGIAISFYAAVGVVWFAGCKTPGGIRSIKSIFDRHPKLNKFAPILFAPIWASMMFIRWAPKSFWKLCARTKIAITLVLIGAYALLSWKYWHIAWVREVAHTVLTFVVGFAILAIIVVLLAGFVMLFDFIEARHEIKDTKVVKSVKTAKEFGSLVGAVAVTRKWKICPLVDLPPRPNAKQ